MMKVKQKLCIVAALILALVLTLCGFAIIARADDGDTPQTIVDECNATDGEGKVADDIYGIGTQSGDVGFGADGRFYSTKSNTEAPTAANMWDIDCAYIHYNVSGHNLIKVTVDIAPEAEGVFDPILVFAQGGGNVLPVNNTVKIPSSNWPRIEYTYIIGEGATWVRAYPTSYVEGDDKAMWMQQITKIEISYTDTLPDKDSDQEEEPEIDPANVEIYTDVCNGNAVDGQRADVYNVSVNNDMQDKIGDPDRIVFGSNPDATESYIDYTHEGQNTIAVTAYEEILEGNTRPENATVVKFALLGKTWQASATDVVVELGDYEKGIWTRLTFIYEFDAKASGNIRLHIYKPVEGQSEIEIGSVSIYHNQTPAVGKLSAKHDLERYSYLLGQSKYSSAKWADIRTICDDAIEAIDEDDADVDRIVAKAKEDMSAVLTADAEFEASKAVWKQEIADFANAKGESNYTAENWAAIQTAVTDACNKIDAATSESAAQNAIIDAKEKINDVEKKSGDEELDPKPDDGNKTPDGDKTPNNEKPAENTKKKCGSAVGVSGIALLGAVLMAAAALLIVRKKTKKE